MTGFEPSYPETSKTDENTVTPQTRYCYYCQRRILPGDFMKMIGDDIVHSECHPMYEKLLAMVTKKVYEQSVKIHEIYVSWKIANYDEYTDKAKEGLRKVANDYLDIIFNKEN